LEFGLLQQCDALGDFVQDHLFLELADQKVLRILIFFPTGVVTNQQKYVTAPSYNLDGLLIYRNL